jgi:hypothetical protein
MINRRFNRVLAPISAILVLCLVVGAQMPVQEKVDLEMMAKIRAEGFERSQVMETISYLTDVYGPRLTGSPNMKKANEWTRDTMAKWGLQNAKLEPWGPFGRGWSLQKFSANVISPNPFPLIAFPKAWTYGTNGPVVGDVVLPDIKTEADFEKYKGKLKNAFILNVLPREVKAQFTPQGVRFTDEELLRLANADPPAAGGGQRGQGQRGGQGNQAQPQISAQRKNEFYLTEGAAALLDIGRVGDGGTIFVGGGGSRDKDAPRSLPAVTLTVEHYNRLVRMVQKGVPVKIEIDIASRFHDDDLMAYNTVAEIPGTDKKDELVMVGAHLDSWHSGTGATDNAAGCAVAMEAVRILKALGVQPRRTIRVALWSGEEQGLLGSRAYVAEHFGSRPGGQRGGGQGQRGGQGQGAGQGQPPAQQAPLTLKPDHAKFSVYFNLDNGTGKIRGVYLQGNEAVRPIFRAWLAPFRDLGASTITISNTGGTDHQSFDGVGLPGFQFIQDEVEYDTRTHHSNMDVYDRIQADDMKQASVIMAAFLYNAAMRDEKLPRKPLPPNTQMAPANGQR